MIYTDMLSAVFTTAVALGVGQCTYPGTPSTAVSLNESLTCSVGSAAGGATFTTTVTTGMSKCKCEGQHAVLTHAHCMTSLCKMAQEKALAVSQITPLDLLDI